MTLHKKLPWAWTFVILTYLFVEWVYNQHLLHLLQYPAITAQQFEWTEMFGKAIAAVGLNLVLAKCYRRPSILKFAVGAVFAYVALTWAFDRAIAAFPDEFRHSSYYGVMHRKTVVQEKDAKNILGFAQEHPWHVRPLVLSQYYLTLQDNQWTELERSLRLPLDKKANEALKDKKALWKKYAMAEEGRQYVEGAWQGYQEAMSKYNKYRNHPRYAQRARETFLARVGAPPDLLREQFIEKKAAKYHAYLNAVFVEGDTAAGIATIRGKDIPLRMDETAFYGYLETTVSNIRTSVAPATKEIRFNASSLDAVALLVIPPLSLGLSLLSIAINLVGLACAWISALIPVGWGRRGACFLVCTFALVGTSVAYTMQPHGARLDAYWAQLDAQFEQNHPILWAAMSIPMRLEPLLCLTSQPVQWIGRGMAVLYKS